MCKQSNGTNNEYNKEDIVTSLNTLRENLIRSQKYVRCRIKIYS